MNVVITGASRGIGFAIAQIFAQHGHDLILTSKNEVNLYNAVEKLQQYNVSIKAKAFDLSDKQQTNDFAKWVLSITIPDILINNSGVFVPGNICDEPEGHLESQLANNLLSAYYVTRGLVTAMKEKRQGHIFNICSIASLKAYANGGSYSISKFALYGFSQNLREELKTFDIKVTSVLPGAVFTDSWQGFDNSNNRIMEAADIAKMVYQASQLSPAACVEDIVIRPQLGDL